MVTLVCKLKGRAATTDQDKKKKVLELVKHWEMEPVRYLYTMTFQDWMARIWPCLFAQGQDYWMGYGTSREGSMYSEDADASGSDATLPMPENMIINLVDRWAESSVDS